jgi:hypothetical protein
MALTVDIIFWNLMPDNFIWTGVTLILICGIIQWRQSTLDEAEEIRDS